MMYQDFMKIAGDLVKLAGIETTTFIAGASGAITFVTKAHGMTKLQRFFTVLSGGFTANYITPLAALWLNLDDKALYGIAFLLGYSGMKTVELLIQYFHKRIESKKENQQNP